MKKIGLCVCYDTKNFGSQLQVLATIKAIENLGFQGEIIRYKKRLSFTLIRQSIPRLLNPHFLRGKLIGIRHKQEIKQHPETFNNVEIRNKRFQNFVERYFIKSSKAYIGWNKLKTEAAKNYDVFLCGSDQLWLPSNLGSHFYTLEFASDSAAKIAYATSFGVSKIPWFQKRATQNYLNRFQSLSVREIAGHKMIMELTGKDAMVVCDPTLLFTSREWADIIPSTRAVEGEYIFCYFLGTNRLHREAALTLQKTVGIKIVTCPYLDHYVASDSTFGDIQLFDMDAGDFVNLIRYAKYVLTDSFHGTVFSILNEKKFLVFNRFAEGNHSRNSRVDSLCELLGLENRKYNGNVYEVEKDIEFNMVFERLEVLKLKSKSFLSQALETACSKNPKGKFHENKA